MPSGSTPRKRERSVEMGCAKHTDVGVARKGCPEVEARLERGPHVQRHTGGLCSSVEEVILRAESSEF